MLLTCFDIMSMRGEKTMKKVNLSNCEAVENFLKEVKSFKLSPATQTVKDFYVIEGDIIFLDKNENPIAFSRGDRMNNTLIVWIVKQYQVNGEHSSVQVPISEEIIHNAWEHRLIMVKHAHFVNVENYVLDGALYTPNGRIIEYLNNSVVDVNDITYMVAISNGLDNDQIHEFKTFKEAINFFDDCKEDLLSEQIKLIQIIGRKQITLNTETGHLFDDGTNDPDLLDNSPEYPIGFIIK